MSTLYLLVSHSTKEYFDIGKFSAGASMDWKRVKTEPEKFAFDIHKEWVEQNNPNFEYPWCLALVRFINSRFSDEAVIEIFNTSWSEEEARIVKEYTRVGDRFEDFPGQV